MATYHGIDVSCHNGIVNMAKVKTEKSFVMIRAGYGKYTIQKDPKFETNYKNAIAANLHVGAYWYSYATTENDARAEAEVFLNVIKGKKFDMPLVLDIEDATQSALNRSTIDKIVTTFMSTVSKAGYYVVLYSFENFLTTKISESVRKKYDVWCANTSTKPKIPYKIHQFSFTGRVSGCTGPVDLDVTTVNYPSLIKKSGLNGYENVLETKGFKRGDKTEGVLALKKLLLLAYSKKIINIKVDSTSGFGSGTEKAVNAILKKYGYKETGIAGSKFINLLYSKIK